MSDFGVVIPSRTMSNLLPCIRALRGCEPQLEPQHIVVVDDGLEWTYEAEREISVVRIIPGPQPFLFARNVNLGMREHCEAVDVSCHQDSQPQVLLAAKRHVVLLNDDALLETPGGLSCLAQCLDEHADIGLLGAVTDLTGQPLQRPQGIGLREVVHFAFVCVMIPARTIDQIGPLDERYCLDYGVEDRDYCETVRRAGLRVAVHDGCFVNHSSLRSSFRGAPEAPRSFAQNYALFRQKWGMA